MDPEAEPGFWSVVLGLTRQVFASIMCFVPTMSLGAAMGWMSMASADNEDPSEDAMMLGAASITFASAVLGVPLSAYSLRYGRKIGIIVSSACFVVCWALKVSGCCWWVFFGRLAAGVGSAGAFSVPALAASEVCEKRLRGAASSALVLAHNLGFLLMFIAADLELPQRDVHCWCLGVALAHCFLYTLMPESPAFLAAHDRIEEAEKSLAWFRGVKKGHPSIQAELADLPLPEDHGNDVWLVFKEIVSKPGERRALIIALVTIVGQESCGIYTLMQFAERAFMITRDVGVQAAMNATNATNATSDGVENWVLAANTIVEEGVTPARLALFLGVVQLISSFFSLILVEVVGRRPLLVWGGTITAICLALASVAAALGAPRAAAIALAGAVAADSGALEPAPYALLYDMFPYHHRSMVLMLSSIGTSLTGAVEVVALGALGDFCLPAALLVATGLSAAVTIYAACSVPETLNRTLEEIYSELVPEVAITRPVSPEKEEETAPPI